MPKILLNELRFQLSVVDRRMRDIDMKVRFAPEGEKKQHLQDTYRQLKDRKRVIEDRIIAYEPDTVPNAPDGKAGGGAAEQPESDIRRSGGTEVARGNPSGPGETRE